MSADEAAAANEWEGYEGYEEGYEYQEEEEEDTTINNSDVVVRYKKAAQWANEALTHVVSLCVPGAKVYDACKAGDAKIQQLLTTMFKGTEKAIAFPTTISTNACVCHWSPVEGESADTNLLLAEGDVARIDLGIQVDGYPVMVAHTIQVTATGELGESKEAAVIAAGYATLDAALRQLRPDEMHTAQVTEVIEQCAAHFGLNPVEGVLSHSMRRYVPDSFKAIASKSTPEHKLHDYAITAGTVWCLDVVLTTGKGKLRERDGKTGIYKPSIDGEYKPKLGAAQELQKEIDAKYSTFPFAVRNLETKKARLGLTEMVKHGVVVPYPVLYEKEGETVVQFKVTVLVTAKKIERVTGLPPQKGCPKPPAYTDEALQARAKLPLTFKKKKAEPAPPAAEAAE